MNTTWQPITEPDLHTLLQSAEQAMSGDITLFWHQIRLPQPELWQQHPWADEICGFWVVAVMGKNCLYFNDRTQGFSFGSFSKWGRIDDYLPSKLPLCDQLRTLLSPAALIAEA
ncbi:hypothetical protein ACQUQU_13420 [Thalassolituus sp. LLYu03]|uniref:hypothetical protein n=1 Tax=Thalassolituus sp. LLYu03 TaxID=3421656 RepID=UPI003D2CFC90